jgi:hypothetical protein
MSRPPFTAIIECATSNMTRFPSSEEGDVLFYPSTPNQGILIGSYQDIVPPVVIRGNNVGIGGVDPPGATLHVAGDSIFEANIAFHKNDVQVGSIVMTQTGTSFNTISDYRVKHVIKANNIGGLDKITQIPVYEYMFTGCSSNVYVGCLAHEVQNVIPYAVHGVKDGDTLQTVDYSKMIPLIIDAIHDLKTEIANIKRVIGA